jgi:hypothetical protein
VVLHCRPCVYMYNHVLALGLSQLDPWKLSFPADKPFNLVQLISSLF